MAERPVTPEEKQLVADMVARARKAMEQIKDYDQEQVDRLARALGWACGNETTFVRIAQMGVYPVVMCPAEEVETLDETTRAAIRDNSLGSKIDYYMDSSAAVTTTCGTDGVLEVL